MSPVALIAQRYSSTYFDLQQDGVRVMAVDYKEFTADAVHAIDPRLIILDFSVPINVVQELGNYFKRSRVYQSVPLLLLLKDLEDFPKDGLRFPPDRTLVEPYTLSELGKVINSLLSAQKAKGNQT